MIYKKDKRVEEALKDYTFDETATRFVNCLQTIFGRVQITNVIFKDPATIVFWSDGTKTVVKAQLDEEYDPEKGLAMAITKKALGNGGNYYDTLKSWLKKGGYEVEEV